MSRPEVADLRNTSPGKSLETLSWEDHELLREASRPATPSNELPGLMAVDGRGEAGRLLDILGRMPADLPPPIQRKRRDALVALQSAGLLAPRRGRGITFRCDLCSRFDELRQQRKSLLVKVPWGSPAGSTRSFLVCSTCAKREGPPARCGYEDALGQRCKEVAELRRRLCTRHRRSEAKLIQAYAELQNLGPSWRKGGHNEAEWVPGPLARAVLEWRRAERDEARECFDEVIAAARAYLDAVRDFQDRFQGGASPDGETLAALQDTVRVSLPLVFSARLAALARLRDLGKPSARLDRQLALHGLSHEPVLTIRFAPLAPDLTEVEALDLERDEKAPESFETLVLEEPDEDVEAELKAEKDRFDALSPAEKWNRFWACGPPRNRR